MILVRESCEKMGFSKKKNMPSLAVMEAQRETIKGLKKSSGEPNGEGD